MKTLAQLARQLEQWGRREQSLRFLVSRHLFSFSPSAMLQNKAAVGRKRSSGIRVRPSVALLVAIVSLIGIIGYRFYNQPQLAVGTVSPIRIEAPDDGRFEDINATAAKRKAVEIRTVPILSQDPNITEQIKSEINQSLEQIEKLRQAAAPFPFVEVRVLSLSTQQYLRSSTELEWQAILAAVEQEAELNTAFRSLTQPQQTSAMKKAAAELRTYRQQISETEWKTFRQKIVSSREKYALAKKSLENSPLALSDEEKLALLQLNNFGWQRTKNSILQASRRILTQGIPIGLSPKVIEQTVQVQLDQSVPKVAQPIATKVLTGLLRPNLGKDQEETTRRAQQAALAVEPVLVGVKKGEVIVDQGEEITPEDFVLLDAFGLSRRGINWAGLGLAGFLVTGAVGIFCLVERRVYHRLRSSDRLLLWLLSLSAPMLAIFSVKYIPLPALGLLTSSFYGSALAVTQVSLLTGLITFATEAQGGNYLLAGAAGGMLAAIIAGRMHSREELALLGVAVGIIQGGVYLLGKLVLGATAGTVWYAALPAAITYGFFGLAWSVVALGVSPYLERLFDLITPIRLAELSNPNRPLLKRLALQAPGTFQHTLFVSSLAEAAAQELNCNVELVRAGTLYHDIGKLHDPLGFIENQMGGPNKHDEIRDPWRSAQIIKKHVTEGLVMARRYGLPKAIQNFIPEHQGTLLISYFYFQAKHQEEQGGKRVLEADFRYDGPTPQSRETGIVMLADGCEAALRSLKDATPEAALAMLNKIFKARWRDEQLIDSGIKYEELPKIADVFVRVWQQYNHKRIVYPKAALEPQTSK